MELPKTTPSYAHFSLTSPLKLSSSTFLILIFLSPLMFAVLPGGVLTIPASLRHRGPIAFSRR